MWLDIRTKSDEEPIGNKKDNSSIHITVIENCKKEQQIGTYFGSLMSTTAGLTQEARKLAQIAFVAMIMTRGNDVYCYIHRLTLKFSVTLKSASLE